MILHLSFSGHYPDIFVEVTKEEYQYILDVEGDKFLFDSKEGQKLIKDLRARPHIDIPTVVVYQ